MNIVYFYGGLGNQMFQYALYRSLQAKRKAKVKGNVSWYSAGHNNRLFELQAVFPNIELEKDVQEMFEKKHERYLKLRKTRDWFAYINYHVLPFCIYFREMESGSFDARVLKLRNAAIRGYWQTEKYFEDIKEQLRSDFCFSYGEEALDRWRTRLQEDSHSIAVHIRRGDYLKMTEVYENLSEGEYYREAMDYMSQKVQDPHFVFFSDDIVWVRENYQYKDAIYINGGMFEKYKPWYDMCLMSCCSHNIIANSSFSWWGAWLNPKKDKIVIAPKRWLTKEKTPDLWCEDWNVI